MRSSAASHRSVATATATRRPASCRSIFIRPRPCRSGLFDKADDARRVMLMRTVDRLNTRFGRDTVSFAAAGRGRCAAVTCLGLWGSGAGYQARNTPRSAGDHNGTANSAGSIRGRGSRGRIASFKTGLMQPADRAGVTAETRPGNRP
jgi:uncharacterized protein DUF4113